MKSGQSFFNAALSTNMLRRCPLWAAYLVYLIVSFTLPLISCTRQYMGGAVSMAEYVNSTLLLNAAFQAEAGIVVAILVVMLFFGHLYNSRGNTLVSSLPIRRESAFLTLYLTGVIPLLLCQMAVVVLTALLTKGSGAETSNFVTWLLCAALGLVTFYGIATFCAMLTGNIVILPIVYFVLNLTAVVFEDTVKSCLTAVIFGIPYTVRHFSWLSPIVNISYVLEVRKSCSGEVSLNGLPVLGIYALAGLMLAVLALILYRRRQMECVSDVIAIPVLKPIFRYCMGFGTAFVAAAAVYSSFFEESVFGTSAAWLTAGLLVFGAILGWVIAEMMIRRSVRIFPLPWKGLGIVCAICVLTVVAAETDAFGYERRVPNPEKVESVCFGYDTTFKETDNIRKAAELQRDIIQNKELFETASTGPSAETWEDANQLDKNRMINFYLPLVYQMENGSQIRRNYTLYFHAEDVDIADSMIGRVAGLLNTEEGILSRMKTDPAMEEKYVDYAVITRETEDGDYVQYRLTPKETLDLWNNAMIPDASEKDLCLYTIADTAKNLADQTNLRIEISLTDSEKAGSAVYWYHSFRVFVASEETLKWIDENTDLEWMSMAELRKLQAERNEPLSVYYG